MKETIYGKTRQLPKFNFKKELLAVINGSYRKCKTGWKKFSLPKFNCHISCKRGKLQKKGAQHAKMTRIPKSSGKVKILKEGKREP